MSDPAEQPLIGGNMNNVVRVGDTVRRATTPASGTIHSLLTHLHKCGIDWVPQSLGIDEQGRDVFSYIEGVSGSDMPDWIWRDEILVDVAQKLRAFHDATTTFDRESAKWNFPIREPDEVIVHHDFAPYNCIFRDKTFVGLIDFDLCAPGPRLWDIAYTAYRFVPLWPDGMSLKRLELFVAAYKLAGGIEDFNSVDVLKTAQLRLQVLAEWSFAYASESNNPQLAVDASMYLDHAAWLKSIQDPHV